MNEIIKQAGIAVREAINKLGGIEGSGIPDYEAVARAALSVLDLAHEPTAEMIAAGKDAINVAMDGQSHSGSPGFNEVYDDWVKIGYEAMERVRVGHAK